MERLLTLLLLGDVMTGRGVDQILPHPADPALYEPYVSSALEYVRLAEAKNGPIPRPVTFDYVWGVAREAVDAMGPDLRIANLETAITGSGHPWPKGIHYRMHPDNIEVLRSFRIDVCNLANNHVLDWGEQGLLDTIAALERAGIAFCGAGRDRNEAARPAICEIAARGRVLVFGVALPSSGVPAGWAAGPDRPGVHWLSDLSRASLERLRQAVERAAPRRDDLLVLSIHWGANWGYEVGAEERSFAHLLVEELGFHVVHGHSSHHPKGVELWKNAVILYGCGDFLNDYEGIEGYESFRDDLVLAWLPRFTLPALELRELRAVPFHIRRLRLEFPSGEDADWLARILDRECRGFGLRLRREAGSFRLLPEGDGPRGRGDG